MWIEPEQLAQVKIIDLYSYLAVAEPGNLKRCGQDEYRLIDHDSLKVSVSIGKWNWRSQGFGGTTALQYLITVRGFSLPQAAQMVLESKAAPYSPLAEPPPARPFSLPEKNDSDNRMIDYLCGKRGLCREIVEHYRTLGTLHESAQYHSCVFVGRDECGTPRHAAIRATEGDFKQDVEGSDKRYTFALQAQNGACTTLYVYESAIDAMSGASLFLLGGQPWKDRHYLSLAGVSPLPILQYLTVYPEIRTVVLCMDDDEPGRLAAERIKGLLHLSSLSLDIRIEPPKIGCDYNQYLYMRTARNRARQAKKSKGRTELAAVHR
ncbi:DUF3991 and toprim domain-containing protein [Ruminococcaceae bacterium OttesenSCG-928-I18]|nr:DUF3991 and toprim domain-containing protein [Ruminococcaceae bacterium OttesenSCG-928-I18]